MLEVLKNSSVAWAILALLTIFSVIFAIATWIIGKKKKRFSVECKTSEIIIAGKTQIEKLHIQYDNKDIDSLSSSKFYVWNSGNTVIDATDIVSSRPLTITSCGKYEIFEAQIVRVSDESNAFCIEDQNDKLIRIAFEYVDHGDGFVVQVLHTGSARNLKFDCKIKGGNKTKDLRSSNRMLRRLKKVFGFDVFFPMISGYAFMALSYFPATWLESSVLPKWLKISVAIIAVFLLLAIGIVVGMKTERAIKNHFHMSIPESLIVKQKETRYIDYADHIDNSHITIEF